MYSLSGGYLCCHWPPTHPRWYLLCRPALLLTFLSLCVCVHAHYTHTTPHHTTLPTYHIHTQVMSGVFMLLTGLWAALLLRPANKQQVFKIHWLMLLLVFFKALTLMAQVRVSFDIIVQEEGFLLQQYRGWGVDLVHLCSQFVCVCTVGVSRWGGWEKGRAEKAEDAGLFCLTSSSHMLAWQRYQNTLRPLCPPLTTICPVVAAAYTAGYTAAIMLLLL